MVGHGAERVTKKLQDEEPDLRLQFVEQQRGTGDAVSVGLTGLPDDPDAEDDHDVLAAASPPRLSQVAGLVNTHRESGAACTILTGVLDDPTGYGRIVRGKDDRVARIVEELDATPEERGDHRVEHVDSAGRCWPRRCGACNPRTRRASTT